MKYTSVKIPSFSINYPVKTRKRYGWSTQSRKTNTKEILADFSKGYCMYCFSKVKIDRKNFGQIEHAIEKSNSKVLEDCVPNLGIACSVCNTSFKKKNESNRVINATAIANFERDADCTPGVYKCCNTPCGAYKKLQNEYISNPYGKILLQPLGITNASGNPLLLQYDILTLEFQPATDFYKYSTEDIQFLNQHIQQFNLNDPQYKTRELISYLKDVIDNEKLPVKSRYNNMVVELFAETLESIALEDAIDICQKLYMVAFKYI